ncbi:MAG: hybrid sensory histidine kinase BarA [Candidatus Methanofastidiosum methylothiophilum]|uniref:Hybrid sensory histidine kinase BarA n=1 Tax=Candidatus Methanofastidiosum methylothiophilum TaxID=1705564 RepID=A0A150JAH0_9EURY|nr:MAG: hybrid sensory histidine kinase BarA [Candidatus Methanofastidiosum methylthiophilus]NMC76080.1 response regulator [Candidatus Methanofastidiosa archaeon]
MGKILIVEDNENNLYLTKYILEKNGHSTIFANTGNEGIKKAIEEKPDLIIMDIQLPDINGLEATKKIRESTVGDSIPIVALTSYAMVGDKEKALQAGCTGYIEKPIDPEKFIYQIAEFLK